MYQVIHISRGNVVYTRKIDNLVSASSAEVGNHRWPHSTSSSSQLKQTTRLPIRINPLPHNVITQRLREIYVSRQNLDTDTRSSLIKHSSNLNKLSHRPFKPIATPSAIVQVKCAFTLGITRGEDFKNVKLSAAGGPAAARSVLLGSGNAPVKGPEGGHVRIEAGCAVEWHAEFEKEHFVVASEALYMWSVLSFAILRHFMMKG